MSAGAVGKFVWGSAAPVAATAQSPAPSPDDYTKENPNGFNDDTGVTLAAGTTPDAAQAAYTSTFEAGLRPGMTERDLGNGKYEIIGVYGESYGTGYKDVRTAIRDYGITNADRQTVQGEDGKYTNKFLMAPVRDSWRDANGTEYNPDELAKWQNNQQQKARESAGEGAYGQYTPSIYDDQDMSFFAQTPVQLNEMGQPDAGQPAVKSGLLNHQVIDPLKYKTKEEAKAALYGVIGPDYFGGVMGDWEALGQVIQGHDIPAPQEWGRLPSNGAAEAITGENTLYGSKPVFGKDAKGAYTLLGYQTDLSPNTAISNGESTETGSSTSVNHNGKSHSWSNNVWREVQDPEWWKKNTIVGEGDATFIPKEVIKDISGWVNKDGYGRQKTGGSGGLFGKVFDVLDPILDKIDPLHNPTQDLVVDVLGVKSQKEAFGIVAPIVLSIVSWGISGPASGAAAGSAATTGQMVGYGLTGLNVANSISNKNYMGAFTTLLGAGVSSGAFDSAFSEISKGISEAATAAGMAPEMAATVTAATKGFFAGDLNAMTGNAVNLPAGLSKAIGGAVKAAVTKAVMAGASGAEVERVMQTAILSGMASLVGSGVGALTDSSVAGAAAGAATGVGGGMLAQQSQAQSPSGNTQSSGGGYTAPAATPSAQTSTRTQAPASYAGSVGRFIWR